MLTIAGGIILAFILLATIEAWLPVVLKLIVLLCQAAAVILFGGTVLMLVSMVASL